MNKLKLEIAHKKIFKDSIGTNICKFLFKLLRWCLDLYFKILCIFYL